MGVPAARRVASRPRVLIVEGRIQLIMVSSGRSSTRRYRAPARLASSRTTMRRRLPGMTDLVAAIDWASVAAELDEVGGALTSPLLTPEEADGMADLFEEDGAFRSTVDMARHRFGSGRYCYLRRPLPEPVDRLRHALYPRLLPVARAWAERLGRPAPWPDTLDAWLERCHAAGQDQPTPLLLRYGPGDWNALHRDLYGDLVFPLQIVINLSRPGVDHTGGELLLVEQRPRAQSRGSALTVPHTCGAVFTTRDRPVPSARGWSAAPVRHGVSVIRSGSRTTLGIIFHDAA